MLSEGIQKEITWYYGNKIIEQTRQKIDSVFNWTIRSE